MFIYNSYYYNMGKADFLEVVYKEHNTFIKIKIMKLIENFERIREFLNGIEIYEGTTFGKTTYTLKKCMCTIGTYYTKEDAFYHAVQYICSQEEQKERREIIKELKDEHKRKNI